MKNTIVIIGSKFFIENTAIPKINSLNERLPEFGLMNAIIYTHEPNENLCKELKCKYEVISAEDSDLQELTADIQDAFYVMISNLGNSEDVKVLEPYRTVGISIVKELGIFHEIDDKRTQVLFRDNKNLLLVADNVAKFLPEGKLSYELYGNAGQILSEYNRAYEVKVTAVPKLFEAPVLEFTYLYDKKYGETYTINNHLSRELMYSRGIASAGDNDTVVFQSEETDRFFMLEHDLYAKSYAPSEFIQLVHPLLISINPHHLIESELWLEQNATEQDDAMTEAVGSFVSKHFNLDHLINRLYIINRLIEKGSLDALEKLLAANTIDHTEFSIATQDLRGTIKALQDLLSQLESGEIRVLIGHAIDTIERKLNNIDWSMPQSSVMYFKL